MTAPREWPNDFGNLRNNMAELLRENIESLMAIQISKLTADEEKSIESAMRNDILMLRALEKAGSLTDPIKEIDNRILALKTHITFASARI
ncbi:MAG: hypothetical protein GYA45_11690 [Pelolinea sp.]|nr:hypothetical protein [Pelolinea sp.]